MSNQGIKYIVYKSYYMDFENDLYYLKSRYYNPSWGRFISSDKIEFLDPSVASGLNLYVYCLNNPVMYDDPEGTTWRQVWIAVMLIGFVLAVPDIAFSGAVAANISAVIGSNQDLNCYENIDEMSQNDFDSINRKSTKYDNGTPSGDTSNLSIEQQIAYIRYIRGNDAEYYVNWTEAQMLREMQYHIRGYEISEKTGNLLKHSSRYVKVDYEKSQNLWTYVKRFIGNLLW